jgi:hypothetical protein
LPHYPLARKLFLCANYWQIHSAILSTEKSIA